MSIGKDVWIYCDICAAEAPAPIFDYTYGDGTQVNGNPTERATFDEYRRAHNEQAPASVAALREWYKTK